MLIGQAGLCVLSTLVSSSFNTSLYYELVRYTSYQHIKLDPNNLTLWMIRRRKSLSSGRQEHSQELEKPRRKMAGCLEFFGIHKASSEDGMFFIKITLKTRILWNSFCSILLIFLCSCTVWVLKKFVVFFYFLFVINI